jgi:hypothetical protein
MGLVSIINQPAQSPAHPWVFHYGPFRFVSEIYIPELRESTGSGEIEVTISLGGVPQDLDGGISYRQDWQVAPTAYLFEVPGVARYCVRDGREVKVELDPGAAPCDLSGYLLGSVFGALCHQNGLLPLHASAVESGGVVTAFVGNSGAGKSTLAACLQRRGHRIVSDDICLLQPDPDAMRVVPVAGWLKLWRESFQHLGETPDERNRIFSDVDKYRLYLPVSGSRNLPLGRVVFLATSPDEQDKPTLEPVPVADAIAGLIDKTYLIYVAKLAGQQVRLFRDGARVFQHAQAWRLTVPWGLDRLDSVVDLLEKEILGLPADAASRSSSGPQSSL